MMTIKWKYISPLKDQNELEEIAQKYSIRIPDDLRDCIIKNNGAIPDRSVLDTPERKGMVFGGLLSFNKEDDDGFYGVVSNFTSNDIHLEMFPFGLDPFGNFYCLQDGHIVFYDHETDDSFVICDNITQLLAMLH